MRRKRSLSIDLLLGAAAGAAATWLMDAATTVLQKRESEEAQERENAARGDKSAYEIVAEKGARLAGRELDDDERKRLGAAIHWTLGISSGVLYAALRHAMPRLRLGSGLAYGTLFWLGMDEAALTALGLTPAPQAFPWQTHARGLAGHLVLGSTIELAFDAADAFAA